MKRLNRIISVILVCLFLFSGVSTHAKTSSKKAVKKPARVTKVKAKAINKTTIKITFKKVKGAKGYKIYRSTKRNKKFKLVKTTKKTYFKNKNLKSNKKYFYKVKAYKKQGKKTYLSKKFSKVVWAKTPPKKSTVTNNPSVDNKPTDNDTPTVDNTPPTDNKPTTDDTPTTDDKPNVNDDPAKEECFAGDSCLNINGTGADNMIWSWWYYPQVVSNQNKVFFCYTTNDGYCGIAQYDKTNNQFTKTTLKKAPKIDDHNSLALTLLDDNKIMCAYAGGHNSDKKINIRISKKPLDITEFEHSIVLESSGLTCYGQIVKSNGKYYLFYRVNNNNWAYRWSENGLEWSNEVIFVKASMQYYCKVMPTTDENLLRIVMYSNPSQTSTEIRMGFLNTTNNSILNSDGVAQLSNEKNDYTSFNVILDKPDGSKITQRLFDVAITEPKNPRFLYTVFNKTKGSEDSIYYLYDSGKTFEICKGGKPLMNPKYQLGASFLTKDKIVVGRNEVGTDYIETYVYNGETIVKEKVLDAQVGVATSRNARPIVDVNGKAILWHNGYYNSAVYTDFDTDARLYLVDEDKLIADTTFDTSMEQVKPENVIKATNFTKNLANGSKLEDYTKMGLLWKPIERNTNWIYYTGLVFEGLLEADFDAYKYQIKDFYDQYINEDGSIKTYNSGELDSAILGVPLLRIANSDIVTEQEKAKYYRAANFIYSNLENQTIYPQAGNLWLHSQNADGTPKVAWVKWNICLDGVYMSQLFLTRLATEIDNGNVTITDKNGDIVKSENLWNDIYSRLDFVMKNMTDKQTGLLNHGYCVETGETNNARWSRGIGWFAMALIDAAEKMPDKDKKESLNKHFNSLMSAICRWQDEKTNLWYNVTDAKEEVFYQKDDGKIIYNIPETSGSAMFSYCLLKGYQVGLLKSEEFRKAGLRAFNSLAECKLKDEGLTDILSSSPVTSNKIYQVSDYVTNDGKGVGPFILATKYAY